MIGNLYNTSELLETRDPSILEREKELKRELEDRQSQADKLVEAIGQLKDLIQKMQEERKSVEIERKSTQAMFQVRGCITHTGLSIEPISEGIHILIIQSFLDIDLL